MFRTRASKRPDGAMLQMEDIPSVTALTSHGGRVILTTEPQLVAADTVYVSGEIPRVTRFERGLPGQHRRTLYGTAWELDEEIRDERFLAVNVAGKGMVTRQRLRRPTTRAAVSGQALHVLSPQLDEIPRAGLLMTQPRKAFSDRVSVIRTSWKQPLNRAAQFISRRRRAGRRWCRGRRRHGFALVPWPHSRRCRLH